MTLDQIIQHAEEKYKIVKGDCRLTKSIKNAAKADYIKKLKVQYGLMGEGNKVNS